MNTNVKNANCSECDAAVALGEETLKGEIIECTDCGSELEVTSMEPITLKLAPEVEEDWGE